MNPKTVIIVFLKEILDIIRDRRTLIFMILLPLIMIPLLFNLMSTFMIGSEKAIASRSSRVAVIGEEYAPQMVRFLKEEEREKSGVSDDPMEVERFSQVNAFLEFEEGVKDLDQSSEMIRDKKVDAVLWIPEDFQSKLNNNESTGILIRYLSTRDNSQRAFRRLSKSLEVYHERTMLARLDAQNSRLEGHGEQTVEPAVLVNPFNTEPQDIAEEREKAGEIFGRILPYLIILLTFGGAAFPAISMAAGEKEQKTLETLLASPASRAELVTGKFMVIVLTGMISAVLSLVGLYYGMTFGELGQKMKDVFDLHIDATSIALVIFLVIPLAVVFAGLLLTISVFARSYREAQGYMTPLNFLIIIPAFTSFLPGIELNYVLSLVPVMNVSLVLKEVLSGNFATVLPYYSLTFGSTIVFGAITIWLCAWMFKNENAIFKV